MHANNRAFDRLEDRLRRITAWQVRHRLAFRVILCTVAFGLVGAAMSSWEWLHVRGRPVEHAEVIRTEVTGDRVKCGRYDRGDVYEITWHSPDPPAGLPADFTSRESCTRPTVGTVDEVVRTVDSRGSVHVWDEPATSLGYVAAVTAGLAAAGVPIGLLATLLDLGWRRLRRRFRRPAGG